MGLSWRFIRFWWQFYYRQPESESYPPERLRSKNLSLSTFEDDMVYLIQRQRLHDIVFTWKLAHSSPTSQTYG